MHRIAPFALCICALVAGADELTFAHPLLGQPVVVSWSLEQLTSAPGEPETHAPVAASDKGIRLRMSRSELPHGTLVVTVVATNASDRRFFLRPVCSVTVHDGKNRFFNGYEDTRTLTFDPDDVMLSNWFPTNAAYDGDSALILGLDPMQLYSRVDAGRNEVEGGRISLSLALPFVLDPKQTFEYSFVIAACASRYGRRDIIQHWYDVFDTAFRPPSDIDPNVISGESTYLFWKPEAYGLGSTGDLIRRMFGGRGSWEWCYAPFVRGGDWAITDAWSVGFKGHSAEAVEARRTRIRQRMSGARRLDIAPMWYVNVAYTEKTMWEKHFPGIVASDKPSIRRCWSQDVVYPVYSWGNAYADLFVESLNRIPRDYPVTRGIGWDSCFAHRRLPVSVDGVLNTARKSYRDGEIFALEAVGIANLLDVNHRNRAGGYRMANAVNYKLVSPYAIGVRTDAALFEGHPMRTRNRLQRYESMRARLGTRKALVWHKGAAPNEIRWIDWEDMSADTARDAYRQVLE
ncbi:MAG: hypothetical protein KAI66_18345, partial [Lentisphaeria bacterium]|nr:hypothetical protein [Lentisphaeria bacterium]